MGATESYLTVVDAGALRPALSAQLPVTTCESVCVVNTLFGVQLELSIPEVPSMPAQWKVTEWLYQPPASAPRLGVAVTLGALASYFRANEKGALSLPATSRHVPETLALAESPPL